MSPRAAVRYAPLVTSESALARGVRCVARDAQGGAPLPVPGGFRSLPRNERGDEVLQHVTGDAPVLAAALLGRNHEHVLRLNRVERDVTGGGGAQQRGLGDARAALAGEGRPVLVEVALFEDQRGRLETRQADGPAASVP